MKTLHLIRHSNAPEALRGKADIERVLSEHGKTVCTLMASRIAERGCTFSNVFVSPAARARGTIEVISGSLDEPINWAVDNALYTFDWSKLTAWLEARDDKLNDLMIVGHNPAVSELANFLTGEQIAQVPPCTYLRIDADIEQWCELYRECGQLAEIIYPG